MEIAEGEVDSEPFDPRGAQPYRLGGLPARSVRFYSLVMFNKRRSRELAMQMLFVWDCTGEQDMSLAHTILADSGEEPALQSAAMQMATGAWEQREMIDVRVEKIAPQWPPRRQPAVDRNLIRLAVWELTNLPTPPKVVIDEAIELAKHFSTENSPSFINGVLDAVLRENRALTQGTPPPESAGGRGGQEGQGGQGGREKEGR